jgi:hypothetical protein
MVDVDALAPRLITGLDEKPLFSTIGISETGSSSMNPSFGSF